MKVIRVISMFFVCMSFSAYSMINFIASAHEEQWPSYLEPALDANYEQLMDKPTLYTFLSGWWVKPSDENYQRIQDARKFAAGLKEIQQHEALVHVPQKYPYVAPNGCHYVIAQSIPGVSLHYDLYKTAELLNKKEAEILFKLAVLLRWSDCKFGNFLKTEEGGVYIVDTELIGRQYHARIQGAFLVYKVLKQLLCENASYFDKDARLFLGRELGAYSRYGNYISGLMQMKGMPFDK